MMLIGCSSHSFRRFEIDQLTAATAAAGLEAIELVLRPHPWQPGDLSLPEERTLDGWRTSLKRDGVRVAAANIASGDPLDPSAFALATAKLHAARRLGASVAVTSAGDPRDANERRALLDRLRQLADAAGELEMTLAFDTLPGLCEDARTMIQTCSELDHPAVKICFDTARYLALNGEVSGEIALLRAAAYLAVVRLTDTVGVAGQEYYPALGGGGCVDFARTLQIVRGVHFAGPCVIDFDPRQRRPAPLEQHQAWLDESVALLRFCGWFD
jgi:inosose dehydratase